MQKHTLTEITIKEAPTWNPTLASTQSKHLALVFECGMLTSPKD